MPRVLRTASGLLALVAMACSRAPEERIPPARSVLLIIVDTLRCDHLGVYGYPRGTTPTLDAFAASGVTFERAYATAPWTLPSFASMYTGLAPAMHGLLTQRQRLSDDAVTLAEILAQEGLFTAAVISNPVLSWRHGLAQGFSLCLDTAALRSYEQSSSAEVTRDGIALLTRAATSGQRFFLSLQYFDPHHPYLPHHEYGLSAKDAGLQSKYTPELNTVNDFTEPQRRFVVDCYDEEIRCTDDAVRDVLHALTALDLADDTLVIVTADHGEAFLERGWVGHIRSLYEELVRVPLLVHVPKAPATRGHIVREPASLLGLPATVLDLLGFDSGSRNLHGSSFADQLRSGGARPLEDIFFEVDYAPVNPERRAIETFQKGVLRDGLKLIRDDTTSEKELYDVRLDPGEKHNLAGERPAELTLLDASLRKHLEAARANALASEDLELTSQQIEKLHALGYAGQ